MITEGGLAALGLFENKVSWKCGKRATSSKGLRSSYKGYMVDA